MAINLTNIENEYNRIQEAKFNIASTMNATFGTSLTSDDPIDEISTTLDTTIGGGALESLKPIRGIDYWTEEDKDEIIGEVIEYFGGQPVYGIVNENNDIIMRGKLSSGAYYIRYEMEDGSMIDIGDFVVDNNTYYSVTYNLTKCVATNNSIKVISGGSYSTSITANSGYELKSISVTMGGTNIPVSNGTINITSVTGDIIITAVAEAVATEIINQIPISTDANGNLFVGTHELGGDGYEYGYRISTSTGEQRAQDGVYCSGFIPATLNDVIRIKGITKSSTDTYNAIAFYDSSKVRVQGQYILEGAGGVSIDGDLYTITPAQSFAEQFAFFRFSCGGITDDTIVTVNQEIINTETESNYTNIIPTLTDIDLTTIYNDIGYKENVRISLSSISDSNPTGERTQADTTLLGIMPLGNDGDVLHLRGALFFDNSSYSGLIWYYDASGTLLNTTTIGINTMQELIGTDVNGDATFTLTHNKIQLIDGAAYIRLNIANPTGELIMTRNQLIPKD